MTMLIAGVVLAFGGLVQGMVGFGMALVAVPMLALVDPGLVPGPLLLITSVHTVLSVVREHEHVDWRGVGWAMLGRIPGTAVGVLIVDSLAQRHFLIVVGVGVLAFTVLSVISWHPRPTPPALSTAGVVGGVFGTAMAIGGPPMALLYQHEKGARIRSTLGAYLMFGSITSVATLAGFGHLSGGHALTAAALLPFMVAGFALSGPARKLVDRGFIRPAVLVFAAGTAVVLILRSLLG
jgi:uncharacterized membrane protein YfcA